MGDARPKASLCVPTFNRAAYLRECLPTLLAQTHQDFELVISDNASDDGTEALIRGIRDPRLRYERSAVNVGSIGNWNRCVRLARGEFVAIVHDDDRYEPEFLAQACAMLEAHPAMGFVHTAAMTMDGQGRPTGRIQAYAGDQVWRRPDLFDRFLERNHDVVMSSVVARRAAYEAAGPFDEALLCADFEMWLRMACLFDAGYIATPLMWYRSHPTSTSLTMAPGRFVAENRLIVDRVLAWAAQTRPELEAQRQAARAAVDRVWARRMFRTAWALLADGALAQAAAYFDAARALEGPAIAWRHRWSRACVNPVGHRIARTARAVKRRCRGGWPVERSGRSAAMAGTQT